MVAGVRRYLLPPPLEPEAVNVPVPARDGDLVRQVAMLRATLLDLAGKTQDPRLRAPIAAALGWESPAAEAVLRDAHYWKLFWERNLRSRQTLALHSRERVEEELDLAGEARREVIS